MEEVEPDTEAETEVTEDKPAAKKPRKRSSSKKESEGTLYY